MKLKKIIINNFKNISKLEVVFADTVTVLYGLNGSNKTSIRDAIDLLFNGKSAITLQHRSMMIKDDKTLIVAYGEDDKHKFEFKRSMTDKDIYQIRIKSLKGDMNINKDELINTFFLNPIGFSRMDPKDQTKYILPDLDLNKFNDKINDLKSDYTVINKERKKLQTLVNENKCELPEDIDIDNLDQQIEEYEMLDSQYKEIRSDLKLMFHHEFVDTINNYFDDDKLSPENIVSLLKMYFDNKITACNKLLKDEELDFDRLMKLSENIKASMKHKDIISQYNNYLQYQEDLQSKEEELEDNKAKQTEVVMDRQKYLSDQKLPFPDFFINDNGELMIDDDGKEKYFNRDFFSRGEIIMITINMLKHFDSKIKFIYLEDYAMLDKINQNYIKDMIDNDIQLVVEEPKENINQDNYVLLKEGKISSTDIEQIDIETTDEELEEVKDISNDTKSSKKISDEDVPFPVSEPEEEKNNTNNEPIEIDFDPEEEE